MTLATINLRWFFSLSISLVSSIWGVFCCGPWKGCGVKQTCEASFRFFVSLRKNRVTSDRSLNWFTHRNSCKLVTVTTWVRAPCQLYLVAMQTFLYSINMPAQFECAICVINVNRLWSARFILVLFSVICFCFCAHWTGFRFWLNASFVSLGSDLSWLRNLASHFIRSIYKYFFIYDFCLFVFFRFFFLSFSSFIRIEHINSLR